MDNVIEYNVTGAAIAELREKYKSITAIKDKKDYKIVVSGIRECRELRVKVENQRKLLKADALAWGKKVDESAKSIRLPLEAIEKPLKDLKQLEDDRIQKEKDEKARIERQRIDGIRQKIIALKIPTWNKSVKELSIDIATLKSKGITKEEFQEFYDEAVSVRVATLDHLESARTDQLKLEKQREENAKKAEENAKEAARLKKDREELDAKSEELDAKSEELETAKEETPAPEEPAAKPEGSSMSAVTPDEEALDKYINEVIVPAIGAIPIMESSEMNFKTTMIFDRLNSIVSRMF